MKYYPPTRIKTLEEKERLNLECFIQTFIINMYGVIDNLALIINSEKELNLNCKKVSLFNNKIH